MKVAYTFNEITPSPSPNALTIGMFDGLHLGHQMLLKRLKSFGSTCVVTFDNHPTHVLFPDSPVPLITPIETKLHLLKKAGIDQVLVLHFTSALAKTSYDTFLESLHDAFPFDHLVLGKNSALGSNRSGNQQEVEKLEPKLHFKSHYLDLADNHDIAISSGRIRTAISKSNFLKALELLGRPYTLTITLDDNHTFTNPLLCSPPDGTYQVLCTFNDTCKECTLNIQSGTLSLETVPTHTPLTLTFTG